MHPTRIGTARRKKTKASQSHLFCFFVPFFISIERFIITQKIIWKVQTLRIGLTRNTQPWSCLQSGSFKPFFLLNDSIKYCCTLGWHAHKRNYFLFSALLIFHAASLLAEHCCAQWTDASHPWASCIWGNVLWPNCVHIFLYTFRMDLFVSIWYMV